MDEVEDAACMGVTWTLQTSAFNSNSNVATDETPPNGLLDMNSYTAPTTITVPDLGSAVTPGWYDLIV